MNIAHLTDRAVAKIEGKDAISFLQGLITNDAALLAQETPLFTALLSPQGKFLFDFFVLPFEGAFLIDADKERLPELLKRLNFYKLRAAVAFEALPDYQVTAVWGEGKPEGYNDPRLSTLGNRSMAKTLPKANASLQDYEYHRIMLGVPDGAKDLVYDRSLVLAYGYEGLHAVSFTKGCYVGQEVTARSKHRGTLRRMLFQVNAASALPPKGTSVDTAGETIGELLSISGNNGLALLEHEGVESAKVLTTGGVTIQAKQPAWWV